MVNDGIKAAIEERRAQVSAAVDISIENTLVETARGLEACIREGNQSGALKAIELRGRYLGMWDGTSRKDPAPVIEIDGEINRNPELDEAIAEFRRALGASNDAFNLKPA